MLIKLIKSVSFKEAHIQNHLMYLTGTFTVKLLQIVVSDPSPKKVLINFSRLNVTKNANVRRHKPTEVLLSIKSRCEIQRAFATLKKYIEFVKLSIICLSPYQ